MLQPSRYLYDKGESKHNVLLNLLDSLYFVLDMANNQLQQLREKLQSQQRQFQAYSSQCKILQAFLEEQSNQKEQQILKLKQDAINRQKIIKQLKSQNKQLRNQLTQLKSELDQQTSEQSKHCSNQQYMKILQKNKELYIQIQNYIKTLNQQRQQLKIWKDQSQKRVQFARTQAETIDNLHATILQLQKNIQELNLKKSKVEQQLQAIKQKYKDLAQKTANRKTKRKQQQTQRLQARQREMQSLVQKLLKCQQKCQRYQKQIKQLKYKLAQAKANAAMSPLKRSNKKQQAQQLQNTSGKVYTGCTIMTKPYYNSPFLQIDLQTKTLRLYKSSRNGCFQKSLGASKHKVDHIGYDSQSLIKEIASRIVNFQFDTSHSILIYGARRTNKKAIFSSILVRLQNMIFAKLESEQHYELNAVFLSQNSTQDKKLRQQAMNVASIKQLLKWIGRQFSGEAKSPQKLTTSKKIQRQAVIYFCLQINDFCLQIAVSNYTNISMSQKQTLQTFYNNILYSKLPDILQPPFSQKYIILTLNPIVDRYQDCKNTLNTTRYKLADLSRKQQDKQHYGINKQGLNQMARRKLQQCQKQLEQTIIKSRKLDQECFFYKMKFDQIQNRLKNLISTHHGQNSYLKKSPIILSYEKLLKFVHSVQGRTNIPSQVPALPFKINQLDFQIQSQGESSQS